MPMLLLHLAEVRDVDPAARLLFKAATPQLLLFDAPVVVGAHQRAGKMVGPYVARRRKAVPKPPAPKVAGDAAFGARTAGQLLDSYPAGPWVGTVRSPDGRSNELRLIPWKHRYEKGFGFALYEADGKKVWSAPFAALSRGTTLVHAARMFLQYANADRSAEDALTLERMGAHHATEAPRAVPASTHQDGPKPWAAHDLDQHRKLAELRAVRFKTASQEKLIGIHEARIKADPGKWKPGDGVGWRVAGQLNRGYRVAQVVAEEKRARVYPVADTGLTVSGGDHDRLGSQWVHVADLVRDRKYDAR